MNQTVFFNAYIHESAEVGDITYNAGKFHTFMQVIDCTHILVKFKNLDRTSRVTSRFVQFL